MNEFGSERPFSDLIRKRREELDLDQINVCAKLHLQGLNICHTTYSNWDSGRNLPTKSRRVQEIELLATVLKMDHNALLKAHDHQYKARQKK